MKNYIHLLLLLVGITVLAGCASSQSSYLQSYAGVWATTESVKEDAIIQLELGTNGKIMAGFYSPLLKGYQSKAQLTYEFDELTNSITITDVPDLTQSPFANDVVTGRFDYNATTDALMLYIQDGEAPLTFFFKKKFRKNMTDTEVVLDKLMAPANFDIESAYVFEMKNGSIYGVYAMSNYVNIETPQESYSLIRDLAPVGILYKYGDTKFFIKDNGEVEYTVEESTKRGVLVPLSQYLAREPKSSIEGP